MTIPWKKFSNKKSTTKKEKYIYIYHEKFNIETEYYVNRISIAYTSMQHDKMEDDKQMTLCLKSNQIG